MFIVVGDQYRDFADQNGDVITITNFFNKLKEFANVKIFEGQGLSSSDRNRLINLKMNGHPVSMLPEAENRDLVHKRLDENVLISEIKKLSINSYYSNLRIHNSCDILSDHTTGQHIQGMILLEAARQTMISVGERYYAPMTVKPRTYFILNAINIDYKGFVFPIETEIEYYVDKEEILNTKDNFESRVLFKQNNEVKAVVNLEYSAFSKDYLESREAKIASKAINSYMKIN